MEIAKRLTINAFFIMIAKGVQPVISFLMILSIGRILGVAALGMYATAISYILIFQIVASFGLRTLLTREVAKHTKEVHSYIINSMFIAIPLSIISAIILSVLVIYIMRLDLETVKIILILSTSLLASAVIDCFEGVLAGVEKIQTISFIYLTENIFKVGTCCVLILLGYQIMTVIVVHVITRYLALILYLPSILKLLKKVSIRPDWKFIQQLFKTAYIFALIMVFVTIYWNIDIVLINKIQGNQAAGIYAGAKRFVLFLITLIQSFFTAFFPVISGLYESGAASFQIACKKSLQYLMVAAIPVTVIMTFLANKIFYITFGAEYEQSIAVLRILVWIILPYSMSQVFAYALLASNNQRIDLRVNAIAMICNSIISWVLILNFTYIGAAIAALISILIYVSLQIPFIFKNVIHFDLNNFAVIAGKLALSALVMIGFILLLSTINFFSLIFTSTIIYFSVLYLFKTFSEEDLNFIKTFLRKTV